MTALLHRLLAGCRRISPGPGMVRITAFALAAVGMVVALPGPLRANAWTYVPILVLAAVPAARSGTPWVTAVELVVVGEWLLSSLVYQETRSVAAMLAVAATLYAHHTTCALANALPLTARLAPGVLVGWLARTTGIIVGTGVLAGTALVALPPTGTGHSATALPVLGLLAAVCTGGTIVYLLHRRR